jgi:DNA polymerase I-like protein with 3'-5' exonuclease and polymerase domains
VQLIRGAIRTYAWGSRSAIADFTGRPAPTAHPEAELWFGAHPGIRRWHLRTATELELRGYIENKFGARIYKIGRVNLPEYYAWLPQSTVAGVINRALCNIDAAQREGETSILLSLQVHDSLAGQFLSNKREAELKNLTRLASVSIPYNDPLIIPVGIKTSTNSWGDCL